MSNYDNTNRGMLFKSKERRNEKSPEYYGSLNVGGVEYKISAWVKTSKKTGEKFFSLSVRPKEEHPVKVQVDEPIHDESDLPF